jgi:alkaline phosphatase D
MKTSAGNHSFLSIILFVSALSDPVLAIPEHSAGPLVGHVTSDSANLWMYVPKETAIAVSFHPEGRADGIAMEKFVPIATPELTAEGQAAVVTLTQLQPETRYHYQVMVAGQSDPAWNGSFQTAPPVGKPCAFRLAVTSCMRHEQPQASWFLLLAQQPDLHVTLGDTHYADTTDPAVQLKHHVRYRRTAPFATVIRNIPTYAMWDDHDYGPNDSDGTAEGKEKSLEGWRHFWGNPGAGTPDIPGAFFRFTRGEVDFFVVDGRYHRSPNKNPDDDRKRMLGDAQFGWLLDGLKNSRAKFKVIASGSTLDHSKGDGWKVFSFSRHRLFDSIRENAISGVIYMSGDVHRSLVWEHPESGRVGYPFVEVISSGVANSQTLGFATVDFDTTVGDPSMRVRIVHGDGTIRDDRTWTLSQLGGAAAPVRKIISE